MHMPMTTHSARGNAAGFTLIELMIAMVLGLIVIGAVLALSLSMIRANSGTIASTRLTQELRATAGLIASELQRAGSATNPFMEEVVGYDKTLAVVDTDTANCIKYNFFNSSGALEPHSISLSGGAVYVGTTACGAGGTKLSSDSLVITALDFSPPDPEDATVECTSGQQICFRLEGRLSSDSNIKRSFFQAVFAPGIVAPVAS